MGDIVSDGTQFLCPMCAGQVTLEVGSSSSKGDSKKLANEKNYKLKGQGTCLAIPTAPKPCQPQPTLVTPGQSKVKIDGSTALGAMCTFMCTHGPGGPITVMNNSQKKAKHDGAGGAEQAIAVVGSMVTSLSEKNSDEEEKKDEGEENFEKYKTELRANMEKPHVVDAKLKKTIDKNYRENGKVGNGSTAAAIRYEIKTGKKVGGRDHIQKGQDTIKEINKWLKNNPNARSGDRAAAENVVKDLKNALRE